MEKVLVDRHDMLNDFFEILENIVEERCEVDLKKYISNIIEIPYELFLNYVFMTRCKKVINAANIPQYSNFDDCISLVNGLNSIYPRSMTYVECGKFLSSDGKSDIAYRKYGENHSKLAMLMLFLSSERGKNIELRSTKLALVWEKLCKDEQNKLILILILRIPIVRICIYDSLSREIDLRNYMSDLSPKTVTRRAGNVYKLVRMVVKDSANNVDILENISYLGK